MDNKKTKQSNYNNKTKQQDDKQQQKTIAFQDTIDTKSPNYLLSSNQNGLPLFVQREIVVNVKHWKGLDNFVQDSCDK
jgi:hypothetical protein